MQRRWGLFIIIYGKGVKVYGLSLKFIIFEAVNT